MNDETESLPDRDSFETGDLDSGGIVDYRSSAVMLHVRKDGGFAEVLERTAAELLLVTQDRDGLREVEFDDPQPRLQRD